MLYAAKDPAADKSDKDKRNVPAAEILGVSSKSSWRPSRSQALDCFLGDFAFKTFGGVEQDYEHFSPLQRACREAGKTGMNPHRAQIIKELIDESCPDELDAVTPSWGCPDGWAPVHFLAATHGGLELLRCLEDRGAALDAQSQGHFLDIYIYSYIALYIISYEHSNIL